MVAFLFLIAAIVVLGGDVAEDGVCTKDEPGCETVETDSSAVSKFISIVRQCSSYGRTYMVVAS